MKNHQSPKMRKSLYRRFPHTIQLVKKIGIGEKLKKLSTFITFSHYRIATEPGFGKIEKILQKSWLIQVILIQQKQQ